MMEPRPTQDDGSKHKPYLPDNGVVLSPSVEVFRQGTAEGYSFFLDGPKTLDGIVSVAMPNLNSGVSDAPIDAAGGAVWVSGEGRVLFIELLF